MLEFDCLTMRCLPILLCPVLVLLLVVYGLAKEGSECQEVGLHHSEIILRVERWMAQGRLAHRKLSSQFKHSSRNGEGDVPLSGLVHEVADLACSDAELCRCAGFEILCSLLGLPQLYLQATTTSVTSICPIVLPTAHLLIPSEEADRSESIKLSNSQVPRV